MWVCIFSLLFVESLSLFCLCFAYYRLIKRFKTRKERRKKRERQKACILHRSGRTLTFFFTEPGFGISKEKQLSDGLCRAVQAIPPLEFMLRNDRISLALAEATIYKRVVGKGSICRDLIVFPSECRGKRLNTVDLSKTATVSVYIYILNIIYAEMKDKRHKSIGFNKYFPSDNY
uniref:Uncharacterized protein n=1 Tax=Oncorhynchus kisutch TaxID=8019 RepID=A0A8C7M8H8_ONCKI